MLWLLGDRSYDSICSMGCPRCVVIRGAYVGSIWDDGVHISRLSVDQVKLLGFQYGLLFILGTFEFDVVFYGLEQGLEEPIQEDPIVKMDFT